MIPDFTEAKRDEYLTHLRAGMRRGAAAYAIEIPRHVVDGYLSDHPQFAAEVLDAEQTAAEHVEEAIYHAAVSGNVQAARLWMEIQGRAGRKGRGAPPPTSPPAGDPARDPELEAAMRELEP